MSCTIGHDVNLTEGPILKPIVTKNNVKVNKTKKVKEELGGQGHQECQAGGSRRLVKESLRSRIKKAKG